MSPGGFAPGGPAPEDVAGRLAEVRRRIASAGGDPTAVEVVAVTKGFGPDAVRAAVAAGLVAVGENYADELVGKAEAVLAEGGPVPAWHFLGAIQRNKLRRLAPHVACYEGVDRLAEGEAIARLAPGAAVLVEVDFTGAPGRPGIAPGEAARLVDELRHLPVRVEGLMTVAPPGGGDAARRAFAGLARLGAELSCDVLSMGMSDDLELAVAEGATSVRVGRALFGPRPPRGQVPQ